MPVLTVFKITRGFQSRISVGSVSQIEPPVPVSIDFLTGALTVENVGGVAAYNPEYAALKGSAVFADPVNTDGESLIAGYDASVNDTITLIFESDDPALRAAAIGQLSRFILAARNFFQTDWGGANPVYLELRPAGATDSQYALVTDMKLAVNQDVLYQPEYQAKVTLIVRREPFWRMGVPPGDNAKRWTLFTRGRFPSNVVSPTEFINSWYTLTNPSAISGADSLVQKTIYPFDALGTNSTNYIDIPGSLIPGDAPALALVTILPRGGGGGGRDPVFISRDTKQRYHPTVNTVIPFNTGAVMGRRDRNSLNGGDTITSGAWSIFADTNGVRSAGSTTTAYVLRHNNSLVANNEVATWRIARIQFQGRYAVFVRGRLVSGATANLTLRVEAVPSTIVTSPVLVSTPDVALSSTGNTATYLGTLDFTPGGLFPRSISGEVDSGSVAFRIVINKAAAVAVDLRIADILLMPIDEPFAYIVPPDPSLGWSTVDPLAVDSTGLFSTLTGTSTVNGGAAYLGTNTDDDSRFPQPYRGHPIILEPGVTNRLYVNVIGVNQAESTERIVYVDIVPRVRGMRDS